MILQIVVRFTLVGLCSFQMVKTRKKKRTSDMLDESDDSDDQLLEVSPFENDSKYHYICSVYVR